MTSHGDDNQHDGENVLHRPGERSRAASLWRLPEPALRGGGRAAAAAASPAGTVGVRLGLAGRHRRRAASVAAVRAEDKEAKRKKEKRRRLLIAGLALLIMFSGVGVIAGTYFYDQVITPDELTLENSTEVYGSDGTTQIAKLGSKNRSEVAMDKLPEPVRNALIAGEDKNFYTHNGIDLWGIGRAAWNNLTGGATQGASTITQQYARIAANDLEVSYGRKLREAVMARKLEDRVRKD